MEVVMEDRHGKAQRAFALQILALTKIPVDPDAVVIKDIPGYFECSFEIMELKVAGYVREHPSNSHRVQSVRIGNDLISQSSWLCEVSITAIAATDDLGRTAVTYPNYWQPTVL